MPQWCSDRVEGRQDQILHRAIIVLNGKHTLHLIAAHKSWRYFFATRKPSNNIYNVLCFQLLYLDRVEFRAEKVERWFPTALNWTAERVKKRERDEQLPKEYGRGRIIQRLDYRTVTCSAKDDLQQYLKDLDGEQHQQGIYAGQSTTAASEGQQCPYCPHCKEKLQAIAPDQHEPTMVNLTNSIFPNKTLT